MPQPASVISKIQLFPTPDVSTRVWMMNEESLGFKKDLKEYERQAQAVRKATLDFFQTTIPILEAPLPRVWMPVEGDLVEPIRASLSHGFPNITGGDAQIADMKQAVKAFDQHMQLHVRKPLLEWQSSYDQVQSRFPELDGLRRELQQRRNEVEAAKTKLDDFHQKAISKETGDIDEPKKGLVGLLDGLKGCFNPSGVDETARPGTARGAEAVSLTLTEGGDQEDEGGPGSRTYREEDLAIKLKAKQRKHEGLCRDSSWTKSYMESSIVALKDLYQATVHWLGATKQRLPLFVLTTMAEAFILNFVPEEVHWLGATKQRLPLYEDDLMHKRPGSVSNNDDLIDALPELLKVPGFGTAGSGGGSMRRYESRRSAQLLKVPGFGTAGSGGGSMRKYESRRSTQAQHRHIASPLEAHSNIATLPPFSKHMSVTTLWHVLGLWSSVHSLQLFSLKPLAYRH
eukprot:gene25881-11554_t